jgi:hypothetical protein
MDPCAKRGRVRLSGLVGSLAARHGGNGRASVAAGAVVRSAGPSGQRDVADGVGAHVTTERGVDHGDDAPSARKPPVPKTIECRQEPHTSDAGSGEANSAW